MTTGRRPLRDVDAAERAFLIKVAVWFAGPCFILLTLLWYFLYQRHLLYLAHESPRDGISHGLFVALVLLDVPLSALGVVLIHRFVGAGARGLGRLFFAAGDIAPPPSYPRQDALIARGQYAEAADYFRDHIRVSPEDLDARLRLADLLERHLAGYEEAERLYREVRAAAPPPDARQEMAAANGLIDLYTKTGRRDRLMAELARFAERYRRSPQGAEAARRLGELKGEGSTSESPRSPR